MHKSTRITQPFIATLRRTENTLPRITGQRLIGLSGTTIRVRKIAIPTPAKKDIRKNEKEINSTTGENIESKTY
jgi:hypothetical protein